MGENKRPDLRRWLEMMVRENKCPGLEWENEEEMLFRLPWPHQKSRDWRAEDCQIYIEWAKHTGRYKPGDPHDFPTWKTRIRTAINKNREISEVPNMHKRDSTNPYKVYRFLPTTPTRSRRDHERSSPTLATFEKDCLPLSPIPDKDKCAIFIAPSPVYLNQVHRSHLSGGMVKTVEPLIPVCMEQNFDLMDTSENELVSNTVNTAQDQLSRLTMEGIQHKVYGELHVNEVYVNSTPPNALGIAETDNMDTGNFHLSIKPEDSAKLPSDLVSLPSSDLVNSANASFPISPGPAEDIRLKFADKSQQAECLFHVQVLYGIPGKVVNSSAVRMKSCRLFFGSPDSRTKADNEQRTEIQMPNFEELDGISDAIKEKINQALFETEGGEVILTYVDGDIYAERRCLTRVFVSDGVAESIVLPRSKKNRPAMITKIFDFNEKFCAEWDSHLADHSKPFPRDFCYLTFGYEILKNDESPLRIVPVYAVIKHQQAINLRHQKVRIDETKVLISADSNSMENNNTKTISS